MWRENSFFGSDLSQFCNFQWNFPLLKIQFRSIFFEKYSKMWKIFQFLVMFGLFWCFVSSEGSEEENAEPSADADPADPAEPVTINIGTYCVIWWTDLLATKFCEKNWGKNCKNPKVTAFFQEKETAKHVKIHSYWHLHRKRALTAESAEQQTSVRC